MESSEQHQSQQQDADAETSSSPSSSPPSSSSSSRLSEGNFDVVIIGAGVSGMAAARVLAQRNASYVILEANDRPGGRMRPTELEGFGSVQCGAQFIHGENTFAYNWHETNGRLMGAHEYPHMLFTKESGLVDLTKPVEDPDVQAAMDLLDELPTLYDAATDADSLATLEERLKTCSLSERATAIVETVFCSDRNTDLASSSWTEACLAERDWPHGFNDYWLPATPHYLEALSSGLDIRLCHVVTKVDYESSPTQVLVTVSHDGKESVVRARHVIVTCSVAVLQRQIIEFVPALPSWKMDAINAVKAAPTMKVFLRFAQQFWDPSICSILTTQGPIPEYWPHQDGLPVMTCFIPARWHAKFTTTVDESCKKPDGFDDTCWQSLAPWQRTGLCGLITQLQVMFPSEKVTCERAFFFDWATAPFVFCGYSGPSATPALRAQLARNVGRVHFAGEAANLKLDCSMQGAIESGKDTADAIATSMETEDQSDKLNPLLALEQVLILPQL
eukprot:m.77270 g.77270  ORF g.77270 m.77270 type:complete len:504 (-) comp14059_c1_seq2:271-1782(-)